MLEPVCKTCGRKLCHIQIPWEQGTAEIMGNDKLNDDQKAKAREKLSQKLVKKDCCRGSLISYFPTADEMV